MLELDADSFVAPEAMLELVRRMDARPRTALIQNLGGMASTAITHVLRV